MSKIWRRAGGSVRRLSSSGIGAQLKRVYAYISDTTGLDELDRLKTLVSQREKEHEQALTARSDAVALHDAAVAARSSTQAELSRLLQRREHWESGDVEQFTKLTTRDYETRGTVDSTLEQRVCAEKDADEAQRAFMRAIQSSYQSELLFSKKMSALSVYWTSALVVVNTAIFVASTALRASYENERLDALKTAAFQMTQVATRIEQQQHREHLLREESSAAERLKDEHRKHVRDASCQTTTEDQEVMIQEEEEEEERGSKQGLRSVVLSYFPERLLRRPSFFSRRDEPPALLDDDSSFSSGEMRSYRQKEIIVASSLGFLGSACLIAILRSTASR